MNNLLVNTGTSIPHFNRQIEHWRHAASRLINLEDFAAPAAWSSLERYVGITLRNRLDESVKNLVSEGNMLARRMYHMSAPDLQRKLDRFRQRYLKVETTLDFFTDAINTRTNPEIAAKLRGCDYLARRSLELVLNPVGLKTPPVLTYIDKGLGASILKAGLRLWDKHTINPVAAIKIVRHNLLRPTSLIHEAGHQAAHMLGWNGELAEALAKNLSSYGDEIAGIWTSWASEIAADTFAFVHTGYASVASLHDVLAGNVDWVFRFSLGAPHPISYLRVLLNIEFCRITYGDGTWDDLERHWERTYPLSQVHKDLRSFMIQSKAAMPQIAETCLFTSMRAFGRNSIVDRINPKEVSPEALNRFEEAYFSYQGFLESFPKKEALKALALCGLRIAQREQGQAIWLDKLEKILIRIGS